MVSVLWRLSCVCLSIPFYWVPLGVSPWVGTSMQEHYKLIAHNVSLCQTLILLTVSDVPKSPVTDADNEHILDNQWHSSTVVSRHAFWQSDHYSTSLFLLRFFTYRVWIRTTFSHSRSSWDMNWCWFFMTVSGRNRALCAILVCTICNWIYWDPDAWCYRLSS